DEREVVDDQLLLRALVPLAGLPRDDQFGLAIERRMRADQLDQRRQIVEFTAVAHHALSFPRERPFLPFDLTAQHPIGSRIPLMHNATRRCSFPGASL